MITEHKTVYRTDDGKLFVDKDEAERHQNSTRLKNLVALAVRRAARDVNFGDIIRADSPAFQKSLVAELIEAGLHV